MNTLEEELLDFTTFAKLMESNITKWTLGNTLFWQSTLDILLTVSNFATQCQLAVIRLLVDCLLNNF